MWEHSLPKDGHSPKQEKHPRSALFQPKNPHWYVILDLFLCFSLGSPIFLSSPKTHSPSKNSQKQLEKSSFSLQMSLLSFFLSTPQNLPLSTLVPLNYFFLFYIMAIENIGRNRKVILKSKNKYGNTGMWLCMDILCTRLFLFSMVCLPSLPNFGECFYGRSITALFSKDLVMLPHSTYYHWIFMQNIKREYMLETLKYNKEKKPCKLKK